MSRAVFAVCPCELAVTRFEMLPMRRQIAPGFVRPLAARPVFRHTLRHLLTKGKRQTQENPI